MPPAPSGELQLCHSPPEHVSDLLTASGGHPPTRRSPGGSVTTTPRVPVAPLAGALPFAVTPVWPPVALCVASSVWLSALLPAVLASFRRA